MFLLRHPAGRALLLILAFAAPLRAQIMSLADFNAPGGHQYVIGLVGRPIGVGGGSTLLVTVTRIYEAAEASSGGHLYLSLLESDVVEGIDTNSSVVIDRLNSNRLIYTSYAPFVPTSTTFLLLAPFTGTTFPTASPSGGALGTLAMDSAGALYLFNGSAGVQKLAHDSYSTPLFTFGTSGAGTLASQSYGLAVTNNVVYALDLPNHRIVRFDANSNAIDGGYLGEFPVTGDEANSRIAVSGNGRLYLTTGNGGGNIYDVVTGITLDTFQATGGTFDGNGRDALFLDDTTGYLFTFDAATGMHLFYDAAAITAIPEPATYAVMSGLAALGLAAWKTKRRAVACTG